MPASSTGIFAEDEADGFGRGDAFAGVGEESGITVTLVYFHFIGVAACYQQITTVRGNGKIPGMTARGLISYRLQGAVGGYGEYADAIALQTVRGIEEAAVGRQMDVGTAFGIVRVGLDGLHHGEGFCAIGGIVA